MAGELKAGLEIHQQLDTHKLFCTCPSILRNDKEEFTIERELNPVTGETGKIDNAAAFEKIKDKRFLYKVFDTNCLVELDEEPPHNINEEALDIAIQIALLLRCKIFPVTQIMRKTVIDGSNTSGFQRTVLIAHDGKVKTSQGEVRIDTIALEEDSARKDSEYGSRTAYSLDRLGIPLVEITTAADIKNPEQVKEAALKIGEILRACKVKRGIGTIRQDVNISAKDSERVEIKGFQDKKTMIDTVVNEVKRQEKLNRLKENFKKKKIGELKDLTEIFKETDCRMIRQAIENKKNVFGFKIEGLKGILGEEIQPKKRVGTDLSDYAKPFSGIGGIIHSDENLDKYNISTTKKIEIEKMLKKGKDEAFIIILAKKEQATKAREAIKKRLDILSKGSPKEVRQAMPDATTRFLRPMPGAARMYPETDCQILRIKKEKIDRLNKDLPKLAFENKKYLDKFGLNDELIRLILKQGKMEEFKELRESTDHYDTIAKSITIFRKEIARKENKTNEEIEEVLNTDILSTILSKIGEEISDSEVKHIMQKVIQGQSIEEAIEKKEIDLSKEVEELIKERPGLSHKAYMGLIMSRHKGQVSGKEVAEVLQKIL